MNTTAPCRCLAALIKIPIYSIVLACTALAASAAEPVTQVDLGPLLNARIVTTLTAGRLVPWRDALDGITSGEATHAAAVAIGEPFSQALPDDGIFPETDAHPRVALSFSNAEGSANQVRRSLAADSYVIPVPPARYSQFWIIVMSGYGESTVHLSLTYAEGPPGTTDMVIPDWYFPIKQGTPHAVNLASDMGKWSSSNHLMEKDHHFLHAFDLSPDPKRVLVGVAVSKTAKAVLTLWGATAVKAAP